MPRIPGLHSIVENPILRHEPAMQLLGLHVCKGPLLSRFVESIFSFHVCMVFILILNQMRGWCSIAHILIVSSRTRPRLFCTCSVQLRISSRLIYLLLHSTLFVGAFFWENSIINSRILCRFVGISAGEKHFSLICTTKPGDASQE